MECTDGVGVKARGRSRITPRIFQAELLDGWRWEGGGRGAGLLRPAPGDPGQGVDAPDDHAGRGLVAPPVVLSER